MSVITNQQREFHCHSSGQSFKSSSSQLELENNNNCTSVYNSGSNQQKDETLCESTATGSSKNPDVDGSSENIDVTSSDHLSNFSHPKIKNESHPEPKIVKSKADLIVSEVKSAVNKLDGNYGSILKNNTVFSRNIATSGDPVLPSTELDLTSVKVETPTNKEIVKTGSSKLTSRHSSPSLISTQREKILKIRRVERSFDENVHVSKDRERKPLGFGNSSDMKKNLTMSAELKSLSKSGNRKHKKPKKLKKQHLDYDGLSDLFSEPLSVKGFYSQVPMKRERKIPSKFIYLSKMEKYMNQSSKSKTEQKKKHKSKHKHSEYLTQKVKEEKYEIKDEKDVCEISYIEDKNIFSIKDGNSASVPKQQVHHKKSKSEERSLMSSKLSSTQASLSPKSFGKSQILRDTNIHQHCLRRYYRLKSSNWHCSSRHALRMLKKKYNSLRLLFDREPVVCLNRLTSEDIAEKTAACTGQFERKLVMKQEYVDEFENITQEPVASSCGFSVAPKNEINTKTVDLVDPRVMSLSKTLQSGNNGQTGVEKFFRGFSSKPLKSKNKSKSLSPKDPVKKKNKPDWSKWREKLKEASNRMVERKKGLVIERNINHFPIVNNNATPCANSILHFRIPLKSNCRGKNEEDKSSQMKGSENTIKTKETESNCKYIPENGSSKPNQNKPIDGKEDSFEVLKEINEELTIEEYETDSVLGYSINGYSIEISRESPIDITMDAAENSVVNECFDDEEMNKILFGDCVDEVSLNCHTKNVKKHFNDTDANLTVTSDIIPNLCAQDELGFRGSDFSDEVDISPPVLEKLSRSADSSKSDMSDSNAELKYENMKRQDSIAASESLKDVDEMRFERSVSDEDLNTCDEHVDKSCDVDSNCDESNAYDETENENCELLPFVIENVCSLSETRGVYESDDRNSLNANDDHSVDRRAEEADNRNEEKLQVSNSSDLLACKKVVEERKLKVASLNLFERFAESMKEDNQIYTEIQTKAADSESKTSGSLFCIAHRVINEVNTKSKDNAEYLKSIDLEQKENNDNGKDLEFENEFSLIGEAVITNTEFRSKEKASSAITEESKLLWNDITKHDKCETALKASNANVISELDRIERSTDIELPDKLDDDEWCHENNQHNDKTVESIHAIQNEVDIDKELGLTKADTKSMEKQFECGKSSHMIGETEVVNYEPNDDLSEVDSSRKVTDTKQVKLGLTKHLKQTENYVDKIRTVSSEIRDPMSNIESGNDCVDVDDGALERDSEEHGEVSEEVETEMQLEQIGKRKTDIGVQRKRKHSHGEIPKSEGLSSPCNEQLNETMELNEERLMRDFPNHNWLFNKYNISEMTVDNESIKDASSKGKKQKKDDRDVLKKAADTKETKVRKKSFSSTASILPNQRKQSTNKTELSSDSHNVTRTVKGTLCSEHNSVKIKWNKIKRQNSLETPMISNDEHYAIDQKKFSLMCLNKNESNALSDSNVTDTADKPTDSNISNTYNKTGRLDSTFDDVISQTAVDVSIKKDNTNIDFDESVNDEKLKPNLELINVNLPVNLPEFKAHKFDSATNVLVRKSNENVVVNENGNTEKDLGKLEEIKKSEEIGPKIAENLQGTLLGIVSENDEDDDECDGKLEIDESESVEDGPDTTETADMSNSQHQVTDEHKSKPEQSEKDSTLGSKSDTTQLAEADVTEQVEREVCGPHSPCEPLATVSPVASRADTEPLCEVVELISEEKTGEPSTNNSAKPGLGSRSKPGLLDLVTVKSETSSISFRQRTKPPVQLVHPQVHKPPGEIKVKSEVTSEIQTNCSSHTLEVNKEVPVSITITKDLSSGIAISSTPADPQTLLGLSSIVTSTAIQPSTVLRNVAASQVPVTVLSTFPPSSTHDVITTSSSNFTNGIVIPIQPFVQNVANSGQQDYLQNMSQLQPNIVPIQSQPVDPILQQTPPVHIQNQQIPVTIYQAGNQTLISTYTLANQGTEQMVSSQSTNIIQAQPVGFNMNQTQLSNNSVGQPLCLAVNKRPPPLLILPKPPSMPALNQNNQTSCIQTQLTSVTVSSLQGFPTKCLNSSLGSDTPSKISKQEEGKFANSDEVPNRQPATCDQEKSNERNVENVDDEIKKEMEELDREIKRKEQEQEEMRKKKLALLEKIKCSKSSKDPELQGISDNTCKEKSSIKEETGESSENQHELPGTSDKAGGQMELGKNSSLSAHEGIKKENGRSCKDVVLPEVIDKSSVDVFDSNTPIDLSSAIKSTQGVNLKRNLSVTVTDGVISIKESTNTIDSLVPDSSGVHETASQLESERDESELSCNDDEDAVLRDSYTNKVDGINYIEDIGLVNPFTGEYEINEDVEGVEYLDLSAKPDEVLEEKDSAEPNDSKSYVLNKKTENQNLVSVDTQKEQHENQLKIPEEDTSISSSSDSNATLTQGEVNLSIILPVSNVNTNNKTSVLNSSTNLTPTVSVLSSSDSTVLSSSVSTVLSSSVSTVTFSVAQQSVFKTPTSAKATESSVGTPCVSQSMSTIPNVTDESKKESKGHKVKYQNQTVSFDDVPLNLEKVKPVSADSDSLVSNSAPQRMVNAYENTSKFQPDTQIQLVTQPNTSSESHNENVIANLRSRVLNQNCPRFPRHEIATTNFSTFHKEMLCQDQQTSVPDTVVPVDANFQQSDSTYYKHNHRINIAGHKSRGMFQRKLREKIMELKPAHSRSPPRKIQKGAKPMKAHDQNATSRDTMKKMCKTPFQHPNSIQKTSPFICRKHPVFLSPKEVDKPFPRLWEKKPPKPAHSKRAFGIAGHLIVPSARKHRKRAISGDMTISPGFYSLPNTPTSPALPPRATSADYHGSFSPLQKPSDAQGQVCSTSSSVSAPVSAPVAADHHGAHAGLPSPIRAHCRPKSLMSSNQFYETSVLRPPALVRNIRSQSQTTIKENSSSEIIDLTADIVPSPRPNSNPIPTESPRSKEKAIQKELNHAVSKRQRLETSDTSAPERNSLTAKSVALRTKQIMSQVAMMPPPPYVGRQRMPILMQVPRDRAVFEQSQRMPFDRRVDVNPAVHEHNSSHLSRHRSQRQSDVMTIQEPVIRPQMWPSQYSGPTQEARSYGPRAVQPVVHVHNINSGNEHFIPNQEMMHMRGPSQQVMYPPRGTMQTAGSLPNLSTFRQPDHMIGNPRMQHPNNVPVHNIPQQSYPIRGQNIPYAGSQNQTQIHQLLQQPRAFPPQMMQRGETNLQVMQMGETNPQLMQRVPSPQIMQRRETSPQMIMNGNISPQVMQRRMNPQLMQNSGLNGPLIQTSHIPVMPSSNASVMQAGEINQKATYSPSNCPPMMHAVNVSPQMVSPADMMSVDKRGQMVHNLSSVANLPKSQIPVDSHLQGSQSLTQEQQFKRMQQIRAQHIRSQQLQNRNQTVAFEPVTRVPDVRNQHVSIDQATRMGEAVTRPQVSGYAAGISHPPGGSKGPPIQAPPFPQQMAVLESHKDRSIQPRPRHHGQESNKNPPPYQAAMIRHPVILTPVPSQAQFHQTCVQNNVPAINTMQQNVYNMQCPSTSVVNSHVHAQNKQSRRITNQTQAGMILVPQGRQMQGQVYHPAPGPSNMTVNSGQLVQCQTNSKNVDRQSNIHDNNMGKFQNQNPNWQPQIQNIHGGGSEPFTHNNLSKNRDMATVQLGQSNAISISSNNNNNSCQQNPNSVVITTDTNTYSLQPAHISQQSNQTVAMTTNPIKKQTVSQSEERRNSTPQSGTINTHPSLSEGQGQIKRNVEEMNGIVEELPHLQQVHGECVMCGKYSLYLCSNCKKIWYCSPECQLTHWQTHANECEGQTG